MPGPEPPRRSRAWPRPRRRLRRAQGPRGAWGEVPRPGGRQGDLGGGHGSPGPPGLLSPGWSRLTRGEAAGGRGWALLAPCGEGERCVGGIPVCAEHRSRRGDASCPERMGLAQYRRVLPCHNLVWLCDSDLAFESRLCRAVPLPWCARWDEFIKSNTQRD